jgi:hypothetical protein
MTVTERKMEEIKKDSHFILGIINDTATSAVVNSKLSPIDFGQSDSFDCCSQYDVKYSKAQKGVACPIFSMFYCAMGVKKHGSVGASGYDDVLDMTMEIVSMLQINTQKTFKELLDIMNINETELVSVSTNLIRSGIASLDLIIRDMSKQYCIIFCKNTTFFVVTVYNNPNLYTVRDCHKTTQYDFTNKSNLIQYLYKVYAINDGDIIIDGIIVPQLSTLEYVVVDSMSLPSKKFMNEIRKADKYAPYISEDDYDYDDYDFDNTVVKNHSKIPSQPYDNYDEISSTFASITDTSSCTTSKLSSHTSYDSDVDDRYDDQNYKGDDNENFFDD